MIDSVRQAGNSIASFTPRAGHALPPSFHLWLAQTVVLLLLGK